MPTDQDVVARITRKQESLTEALPISGRKPITFLNRAEKLSDALPSTSIERLRALKVDIDPQQIIRGNFGVMG